jgi:hypothetical protein
MSQVIRNICYLLLTLFLNLSIGKCLDAKTVIFTVQTKIKQIDDSIYLIKVSKTRLVLIPRNAIPGMLKSDLHTLQGTTIFALFYFLIGWLKFNHPIS